MTHFLKYLGVLEGKIVWDLATILLAIFNAVVDIGEPSAFEFVFNAEIHAISHGRRADIEQL